MVWSTKQTITEEVVASNPRVEYVPATEKHCSFLAQGLRPSDLVELNHFSGVGLPAVEGLQQARRVSQNPIVGLFDGVPCAMLGCESRDTHGEPWMIGTTILDTHAKLLFSEAKNLVRQWHVRHGQLTNAVWADSPAVNWLRHLGFSVAEPKLLRTADGVEINYRAFHLN